MQQLSIDDAIAQGEQAMQACAANADRKNPPGWTALAFAWVVKWAMARCAAGNQGVPFTAEDFVDDITRDPQFSPSHDERAWGAVVKRAIRLGVIEVYDFKGQRRKGHGSDCKRYVATGKKPTEIYRGDA